MPGSLYDSLVSCAMDYVQTDTIVDVAIGPRCLAVQSPAGVGLAFVDAAAWSEAQSAGARTLEETLRGSALTTLIPRYRDGSPLYTALALAAINSLFIHTGDPATMDWPDLLRGIQRLGMVGYFCPIMDRLGLAGVTPVIFELRDIPGTHKPEEAPALLPGCDGVLLTGASFANKTIHQYIPHIAPGARAFIVGQSTPLADFLLDRFTLGSSRLGNWEAAAPIIRFGGGVRDIKTFIDKVIRWEKQ